LLREGQYAKADAEEVLAEIKRTIGEAGRDGTKSDLSFSPPF
jgi:hypothetical protein